MGDACFVLNAYASCGEYYRSLKEWTQEVSVASKEGDDKRFLEGLARSEEARRVCERARISLSDHRADHGC